MISVFLTEEKFTVQCEMCNLLALILANWFVASNKNSNLQKNF